MTEVGHATFILIKLIAADTYHRYMEWFKQRPEEPWCYWARDDKPVITIADSKDPEKLAQIMKEQPEVIDITHHATVRVEGNKLLIENFCLKLQNGLAEMYTDGITNFTRDGIHTTISKDKDNYVVEFVPE